MRCFTPNNEDFPQRKPAQASEVEPIGGKKHFFIEKTRSFRSFFIIEFFYWRFSQLYWRKKFFIGIPSYLLAKIEFYWRTGNSGRFFPVQAGYLRNVFFQFNPRLLAEHFFESARLIGQFLIQPNHLRRVAIILLGFSSKSRAS